MLSDNFLRDMSNNLQNMQTLQQQLSSGKEISKPSDNPLQVTRAMQLTNDISANTQFNQNINDTSNWLNTTDTALGQVQSVLQRVNELLISAGDAAYGSDERSSIKDEINQNIQSLSQVLNTNFNGKYIFGGSRGTTKPTDTTTDSSGNTVLGYADRSGGVLNDTEVAVTNPSTWAGTTIGINYNGTDYNINIPSPVPSTTTPDDPMQDLVNSINGAIGSTAIGTDLTATKVTNGSTTYIQFTNASNPNVNMTVEAPSPTGTPAATGTLPSDLNGFVGQTVSTAQDYAQLNMVGSKLSTEISQGVSIDYSVSTTDIINYSSGKSLICYAVHRSRV